MGAKPRSHSRNVAERSCRPVPGWYLVPPRPGPASHLYNLLQLFHGPLLQLPDLCHGFIKAGHLGRQFFFFFLGKLREPKGEIQQYGPVPISGGHGSVLLAPPCPLHCLQSGSHLSWLLSLLFPSELAAPHWAHCGGSAP